MAIIEGVIAGVAVQELIQRAARQLNNSDDDARAALERGDIDAALQMYNQTELEQLLSGVRKQLNDRNVDSQKVTQVDSRLRARSR